MSLLVKDKAGRDGYIAQITALDDVLGRAVQGYIVNDEGWTPAEIRSACRLACRLAEPLSETQQRIRPVAVSAAKQIGKRDKWASECALDASTGKLFKVAATATTETTTPPITGRRRLRGE